MTTYIVLTHFSLPVALFFEQVADNYLQEILGKNASLENIQNWLEYEKNGEFLYEILPDIKAAS